MPYFPCLFRLELLDAHRPGLGVVLVDGADVRGDTFDGGGINAFVHVDPFDVW